MREPAVYILASAFHGTLYIGVTSNLPARVYQHRSGETGGFTTRYRVHRLVLIESYATMPDAIGREKQLKGRHRDWKVNLIQEHNPAWRDLAEDMGFPSLIKPIRQPSS